MSLMDCRDKVRLSVSDETGVMRVKHFNIIDAPECRDFADSLKEILLGRPLGEIDADEIRKMPCSGNGLCGRVVADIVEQYQSLVSPGPGTG
jgi:hypothetical protein